MNMTVVEMMLYGGIAAFAVLFIILVVMLNIFKLSRKKLAKKIDEEFDGE